MARWVLPAVVVGVVLLLIWRSRMIPAAAGEGPKPKPPGTPSDAKAKPTLPTAAKPLPPIGTQSHGTQVVNAPKPVPLTSTVWGSGPLLNPVSSTALCRCRDCGC